MIRSVVKSEDGMVMVFNGIAKQIPMYQGKYEEVKDRILRDAPPDTIFYHYQKELVTVKRKKW